MHTALLNDLFNGWLVLKFYFVLTLNELDQLVASYTTYQ